MPQFWKSFLRVKQSVTSTRTRSGTQSAADKTQPPASSDSHEAQSSPRNEYGPRQADSTEFPEDLPGLKQLYAANESAAGNFGITQQATREVDIVAVQGYGGGIRQSFTHPKTNCCWLSDFLPQEFPYCRVFSFQYDVGTLTTQHTGLHDIALLLCSELLHIFENQEIDRPLIFIAHALGGFIVKRVLAIAKLQLEYRTIFDQCAGILFFATPHRGSSTTDFKSTYFRMLQVANSPQWGDHKLNPRKVTTAEQMQQANQDFLVIFRKLRIWNFYETLPRSIGPAQARIIVESHSARIDGFDTFGLRADHLNLCRYPERQDISYKIVSDSLHSILKSFRDSPGDHSLYNESGSFPAQSLNRLEGWVPNIFPKKGVTAMGLLEMGGSLEDPQDFLRTDVDIVAVHGLGGSPKSSWINNEAKTLWLRDFLQTDFPSARVMSYGYKADAALVDKSIDLSLLASDFLENLISVRSGTKGGESRPLILIGYSFGGLIIKKALLLLKDDRKSRINENLNTVISIIFLGVPHDDEDKAMASRWIDIVKITTGIRHVSTFNTKATMRQIHHATRDFRDLNGLYTASIAESKPTRVPVSKANVKAQYILVPVELLRLDWADHEAIFVARNRNHLQLHTFIDAEDPTYVFIRDTISKALSRSGLGMEMDESEACLRILYRRHMSSVVALERKPEPYPGTCDWIFDLAQVRDWLSNPHRVLNIGGPTGCGKTVLAHHLSNELAQRFAPRKSAVLLYSFEIHTPGEKLEIGLASLLYQLCRIDAPLIRYATAAFRQMGEEFSNSRQSLIEVLTAAINGFSGQILCIILDTFTQSGLAREFHHVFFDLLNIRNVSLILIGERPPDLENLGEQYLQMTRNALYVDWEIDIPPSVIEGFVRNQIADAYPDAAEKDKQELEKYALEKSGVSFLPAKLIVGMGGGLAGDKGVIFLDDPEASSDDESLESLYDKELRRFKVRSSEGDWELLQDVLAVILVSFGRMTLEGIVQALNTTVGNSHKSGSMQNASCTTNKIQYRIFEPLRSLLEIDPTGRVDFVHISLIDYLTAENSLQDSKKPALHIDVVEAHLVMTRRCVAHLLEKLPSLTTESDTVNLRKTFTGYSATNWMVHFRACQTTVDEKLEQSVFELFHLDDRHSSLTSWLVLYEELGAVKLPRHQTFGPLFGAAFFGLEPIVEKSLNKGSDIEAQDEEGKTALHWATERAERAIVEILLSHGADPDLVMYDGRTCLHLAARSGNTELVTVLLNAGADVDRPAADGSCPLYIATVCGHYSVGEILLAHGADPTLKTYSGSSVIHTAQYSPTDTWMRVLFGSTTTAKVILRRSIFDNDASILDLTFNWRSDVVIEQYPWVGELIQEELPKHEALDLLLKSEHLAWMAEKPWKIQSKKDWTQFDGFQHHKRCAHQVEKLGSGPKATSLDSRPQATALEEVLRFDTGEYPSAGSSRTSSVQSSPQFTNLENRLDELERREQELINYCGIGGVFPPGYHESTRRLNPGFAKLRLHVAEIMYGTEPVVSLPAFGLLEDIPALQFRSTIQATAYSDDRTSIYSATSELSQRSDASYDSVNNDANFEIWDQRLAQKVLEALENVINGLDFLRHEGVLCDRITLLINSSRKSSSTVVEMKTISSTQLLELCRQLHPLCVPSDTKPSGWTKALATICESILHGIGYGQLASGYLHRTLGSGQTPSPTLCLHLSALIAQIASVSLVTYSRGHSRDFYTTCLTRPIDVFVLGGSEYFGPSICAERINLACMGRMLSRSVWMFHQDKQAIGTFKQQFYLSTGIEDLLDTWGGSISTRSDFGKSSVVEARLYVGGGSIGSVSQEDAAREMLIDNEICCHWSSQLDQPSLKLQPDLQSARLLIGVTRVNLNCPLEYKTCQNAIGHNLTIMGTRSPSWKTTGRSAGLSGGQWVTFSTSKVQTKDNGVNLKKALISTSQAYPDLRQLNSPWALELSLCTGIARRVLLRQLIYGEVLKYLELGLPGEWQDIEVIASTISEKSDIEFEQLLGSLSKKQAKVLKKATELLFVAMESTGVEEDGHTLTLWWPERNASMPRGLKFLKSQYSGKNPWIPMIKDSDHCAVFGMATQRCLQHEDVKKCRKVNSLLTSEAVANIMLDTTLTPAQSRLPSLPYSMDSRYLLWKRTDMLVVTKAAAGGVAQLTYRPRSVRPPVVLYRLNIGGRIEEVKERLGHTDSGQSVLVL